MATDAPPVDRSDTAFFGHPRGLSTLFFTEMWERFSYYGMRAFLIFYLIAPSELGGLGWSAATGGIVLGVYTASVYLMSVPGGWIADRFIGQRKAVLIGGVLIMFGHIVLATPFSNAIYLGLALIVYGTGLLKPNISVIVGQLYGEKDPRRDAGYSLYYMGINLGAFFAPLACGYLAQNENFRGWLDPHLLLDASKSFPGPLGLSIDANSVWHIAFGAAAVGMFAGLVQYVLGQRHLKDAGLPPAKPSNVAEVKRNNLTLIGVLAASFGLPLAIVGLVKSGVLPDGEAVGNFFGVVLILLTTGLFTGLYIWGCQNTDERRRLTVILVLFVGAAMFWGCFEQASGVLNLYAEEFTRNSIFGWEFPASWFQSVNAILIIIFAPVFAALWVLLGKKGKEPSSPAKFGIALVLVAVSFAVMIPAAMTVDGDPITFGSALENGVTLTKSAPQWLLLLYLMQTLAELCLSPVGLSSMSKLAPARWGGLVMGIWFLASANGNFLAGKAVEFSSTMAQTSYFEMILLFPLALSAVFFLLVRPISRMLSRS